MSEQYLEHFGIPGMKWGVRRYQNEDGTRTEAGKRRYNENYSQQQRIRDRKLYGEGAVRRINKRMNKGESIQSARHNEVIRKGHIDTAKHIGKTVAKGALVIGGTVAVSRYLKKRGVQDVGEITDTVINVGRHVINDLFR